MQLSRKDQDLKNDELEKQPIREDLGKFPFSVLWEDETEGGIMKWIPAINLILLFIILVMIWKK